MNTKLDFETIDMLSKAGERFQVGLGVFCIRDFDIKYRKFDMFSRKFAKIKAITPKK